MYSGTIPESVAAIVVSFAVSEPGYTGLIWVDVREKAESRIKNENEKRNGLFIIVKFFMIKSIGLFGKEKMISKGIGLVKLETCKLLKRSL
jgi:hypothetical protein